MSSIDVTQGCCPVSCGSCWTPTATGCMRREGLLTHHFVSFSVGRMQSSLEGRAQRIACLQGVAVLVNTHARRHCPHILPVTLSTGRACQLCTQVAASVSSRFAGNSGLSLLKEMCVYEQRLQD